MRLGAVTIRKIRKTGKLASNAKVLKSLSNFAR